MDNARINIKLTYESLIALLQGKDFHLRTNDMHFVFQPPFDGVFLTCQEFDNLKHNAAMVGFEMAREIEKYTEDKRTG